MSENDIRPGERVVDAESLKALAHPLRVRLVDALSTYGPATASGLAERLGESSGATSYHLRQLARHGFVREVEGRGTARERWWERVPVSLQLGSKETRATPAGRAANRLVTREFISTRQNLLRDYIESESEVDDEWSDAATISLLNLHLTAEQLAEVSARLDALVAEFRERWVGETPPGSRPVQIQINAFPVVDGDITPGEEES